jgi:phenylpropionate dioxygenase-like ring-hydroxylating dioxygenase large terminal subunit
MPPAFYTSPNFLELEEDRIFQKEWICVGRADEVLVPGDYVTAEILGEPIVVVRGTDDRIRVLSNVCRHRGTVIAEGRGRSKRLVCPYHAWTYSCEGQLLHAPHMNDVEGFDPKKRHLPEFRSEIWQGFIFTNLEGSATPLAGRLEGLEPYLTNYHPADMSYFDGDEETWQTNWKCLCENFMEGYHLSFTHRQTLHPITPTDLCEKFPGGAAYTGYRSNFDPKFPDRGLFHTDLGEKERRSALMFWVYPSLVVALAPHLMTYMSVRPLSADSLVTRWGLAAYDGNAAPQQRAEQKTLVMSYNAEDRQRLERVQRGLKSRRAERSPLAPANLAGTIWDFYRYIARVLLPHDRGARSKTHSGRQKISTSPNRKTQKLRKARREQILT